MALNKQQMQVASVVAFYMSAALVMVFVNKAVLNSTPDLPLLFLFIQLVMAVILLHGAALITPKVEIPKMELTTAKKLVPVVAVNIIGLVFNTLCLRDVDASFFQIARGLQLPLTILVASIHMHIIPSKRVIIAASVVMFGFFVGITPAAAQRTDTLPSVLSLAYGVLSSLMIAFHAVLIKSSLPYCNGSTIQLAWWTNAGSALMLAPFILLKAEPVRLMELIASPTWDATTFIWGSFVTGVFGFLLCVAGLLSIKVTSPTSHMFSSAARSVLQTLLGVTLFNDLMTINRGASILVILAGTMYYTWVKSKENAPPPPKALDLESMGRAGNKDNADEVALLAPEKDDADGQ